MASGFLSLAAWVRPFGFVRNERESESTVFRAGEEVDLVVYALLVVLDVMTLPLAAFWVLGVGRRE
ncbi:MAG: hypothetical protein ABEJ55_07525 [Halanaeroarchaeum sp.]